MPQRESFPVDRFLLFVDAYSVTFSHASSITKPIPLVQRNDTPFRLLPPFSTIKR